MSGSESLAAELESIGRTAGLDAVGFTSAAVLEPARTVLHQRKAAGLAGTMNFTYRNPDRSTDPGHILQDAASIVVAARHYRRAVPAPPDALSGRVARYAWRDHYGDLRTGLEAIADRLRADGWQARVHLDDNHLVDRNVAHRAGLGWYGKNANLLLPGVGSWFVLGSVVTNAVLAPASEVVDDGCGPCRACIDECPTGAIVGPGMVDARRCLAWLVQGPGPIPTEFRAAVGDRIYGCDDCQEVCPPNRGLDHRVDADPIEHDADPWIEIRWLLTAEDAALVARVGRWYIAERDLDVVRRTALVIVGNIGDADDPEVVDILDRYARHERPLLRLHAVWAARTLGLDDLVAHTRSDADADVRREWAT